MKGNVVMQQKFPQGGSEFKIRAHTIVFATQSPNRYSSHANGARMALALSNNTNMSRTTAWQGGGDQPEDCVEASHRQRRSQNFLQKGFGMSTRDMKFARLQHNGANKRVFVGIDQSDRLRLTTYPTAKFAPTYHPDGVLPYFSDLLSSVCLQR
jgi:hypothetical protein